MLTYFFVSGSQQSLCPDPNGACEADLHQGGREPEGLRAGRQVLYPHHRAGAQGDIPRVSAEHLSGVVSV